MSLCIHQVILHSRPSAVSMNQDSWKTLGDTIKHCRINVGLWGCGRRRRVLVWIRFLPFYISNCTADINAFSEISVSEFGNIVKHTKRPLVIGAFTADKL